METFYVFTFSQLLKMTLPLFKQPTKFLIPCISPIHGINNYHPVGFDLVIYTITLHNCLSDVRIVKSSPASLQISSVSVIAVNIADKSDAV